MMGQLRSRFGKVIADAFHGTVDFYLLDEDP